jgi:hypothetical protein
MAGAIKSGKVFPEAKSMKRAFVINKSDTARGRRNTTKGLRAERILAEDRKCSYVVKVATKNGHSANSQVKFVSAVKRKAAIGRVRTSRKCHLAWA